MESIQEWFNNGCDYWKGVELYAKVKSTKPALLANLRKKESTANLEKLKYELEPYRIADSAEPVPIATPEAPTNKIPAQPVAHTPVYFQNLPKQLRPVLLQANTYFREACMLKAELNDVPAENGADALALMIRIHALLSKNALCWEQIDFWERHGTIPVIPEPPAVNRTPEQNVKRQAQLFSSISKLKKRLQANVDALASATEVKEKTRLEKNITKQSANLLQQETQLSQLTSKIDNTP